MTKPIEGWVAYNSSDGVYEHDVLIAGQRCTPVFLKPAQINTGDKFMGWEFRPVRVTFTDTLEDEVKKAALLYCVDTHGVHCWDECTSFGRVDKIIQDAFCAGSFWREAVDIMSEHFIAEAIKKERERIWEELKVEQDIMYFNQQIYKAIFGE